MNEFLVNQATFSIRCSLEGYEPFPFILGCNAMVKNYGWGYTPYPSRRDDFLSWIRRSVIHQVLKYRQTESKLKKLT